MYVYLVVPYLPCHPSNPYPKCSPVSVKIPKCEVRTPMGIRGIRLSQAELYYIRKMNGMMYPGDDTGFPE
jgi:hypothetical protein